MLVSFQIFFQNLSCQTQGAAYLRVRLIRRCLRYVKDTCVPVRVAGHKN